MSEANENEWVELPRPFPKTLPKGAKLKSAETGAVWVLENEHRLSAMNLYRGTHYLESDITQRYEDCRPRRVALGLGALIRCHADADRHHRGSQAMAQGCGHRRAS